MMGKSLIGTGSKVLGSLGGAMTKLAGPAGVAITALSALGATIKFVAKKVVELDHFQKELNREYLKMAGPTVGGKALRNMEEFNKSLFNLPQKLRLGLDSKDMQKMFGEMSGAGMSLEGVIQNMGSYGRAIDETRKLSLQFGVDFSRMGSMIADQMLTLRSTLEEVSDSFGKMSYDAQQAGISSEKFYQSVTAATSSLSFYGNYIEYASSLISEFTKNATLGFKDAGDVVGGLMDKFKDVRENRKIVSLLGMDKIQEMTQKQTEAAKKAVESFNDQIDAIRKSGLDQRKQDIMVAKLQKERAAKLAEIGQTEEFARGADRDITSASAAVTHLNPVELVKEVLDGRGLNIVTSNLTETFEYLNRTAGVTWKQFDSLRRSAQQAAQEVKNSLGRIWNSEEVNALKGSGEAFDIIVKKMESVAKKDTSFETVRESVESALDDVEGLSEGFKDGIMRVLERSPKIGLELLKGGKGGLFGKIAEKVKKEVDDYRSTLTGPDSKEQQQMLAQKQAEIASKYYEEAWQSILKQAGDDVFDMSTRPKIDYETDYQEDLVASITDMTKYLDISGEQIKYELSGSNVMESISKWTYKTANYAAGIFKKMHKDKIETRDNTLRMYREGKGSPKAQGRFDTIKHGTVLNTESMYQINRKSHNMGIESTEAVSSLLKEGKEQEAYGLLKNLARTGLKTENLNEKQEELFNSLFTVLKNQVKSQEAVSKATEGFGDLQYVVDEAKNQAREIMDSNRKRRKEASDSNKVSVSLDTYSESRDAMEKSYSSVRKKEKDFKFGSGGWVQGSPGDILVDKDSLAMGLGAGFGGFANDAIRKMDPGSGGSTNNWGGITINVAANDAKDLRNAIPDIKRAMETFVDQKIKRHELKGKTKI